MVLGDFLSPIMLCLEPRDPQTQPSQAESLSLSLMQKEEEVSEQRPLQNEINFIVAIAIGSGKEPLLWGG